MRSFLLLGALLGLGCNAGAVDVTATRGAVRVHFDDSGCAGTLTGNTLGLFAADLTCPANLRPRDGGATLHVSTPLVLMPGKSPLLDEHFGDKGFQLSQFVVISFFDGDRQTAVTCTPKGARGAIEYSSIPGARAGGRLAGKFSDDAALSDCRLGGLGGAADGGAPLKLEGSFDVPTPARSPGS